MVNQLLNLGCHRAGIHRHEMVPALNNDSPTLDTNIFYTVLEKGAPGQRQMLAAQLAQFLAAEDTSAADCSAVVPVVMKLTVDPEASVRRCLADGLSHVANLNADILYSIIADEDDIALPFLGATPALGHWHMLAVLKVGDAPRQARVAARTDLTPEALAHIISKGALEACLEIFDNPVVVLSEADYQMLYGRFGQSGEIVERLLARTDLPLDIRIVQTKRTANRMHQLMAERGWVPANDASELVADAEEIATLRLLVEASGPELVRAVAFLVSKSMLTPSLIIRAACLGEMHVVERSLAHLGGLPVTRTRELMAGRGIGGFKSLHAKSGLPQSCFGILQAACEVAREEAEEGITLDQQGFGRRLIEALMTRYAALPLRERTKHMEFVSRFAEDRIKLIAKRLRSDIARAA